MHKAIRVLKGLPIWGVSTGGAAGTRLLFDAGAKVARDKPIDNDALMPDVRTHEGEYTLFITCPWRIQTSEGVVVTSGDDPSPDGLLVKAAHSIAGGRIDTVRHQVPGNDLQVTFTNGMTIWIFPIETDRTAWTDYSISTPEATYLFKSSGIEIES